MRDDFATPDRATFFEVNRTRLRAWCWGDPTAPPVVLVHGAYDHGRTWDDFAPRLVELGFHVVAIDVRGHGDSGRLSSGMAWSACTIDLCELARVLAPAPGTPIGMIGHSMGGGQILTAAVTTPERFAWLVNLDGMGPPGAGSIDDGIVAAATRASTRSTSSSADPSGHGRRATNSPSGAGRSTSVSHARFSTTWSSSAPARSRAGSCGSGTRRSAPGSPTGSRSS